MTKINKASYYSVFHSSYIIVLILSIMLVLLQEMCCINVIAQPGRPGQKNVVGDVMPSSEELDDGRKSRIIYDSKNLNIRGYVHIPTVKISVAEQQQANENVKGLTDYVNNFTLLKATMDAPVSLESRDIMKYPFVYMKFFTTHLAKLKPSEISNMQKYISTGGFLVFDVDRTQDLKNILGKNVTFRPVPIDHEIYHCFFDFRQPDTKSAGQNSDSEITLNMGLSHGIWINNTLVGISWAGGQAWSNRYKQEKSLKRGVNLVVYALMKYHKLL
ncbi:DUF4159 domain-containing protein [Candidatus Latescibacterota bacterium]